jgi:hypothetical protein
VAAQAPAVKIASSPADWRGVARVLSSGDATRRP